MTPLMNWLIVCLFVTIFYIVETIVFRKNKHKEELKYKKEHPTEFDY